MRVGTFKAKLWYSGRDEIVSKHGLLNPSPEPKPEDATKWKRNLMDLRIEIKDCENPLENQNVGQAPQNLEKSLLVLYFCLFTFY